MSPSAILGEAGNDLGPPLLSQLLLVVKVGLFLTRLRNDDRMSSAVVLVAVAFSRRSIAVVLEFEQEVLQDAADFDDLAGLVPKMFCLDS